METPLFTSYPVIPLQNAVLFPGVTIPIGISRPQSISALNTAKENWVAIVAQKKIVEGREIGPDDLFRIGTIGKVERKVGNDKNGYQLLVRGVSRIFLHSLQAQGGHLEAEGWTRNDVHDADKETEAALMESLKSLAKEILNKLPADTRQVQKVLESIDDLSLITHICAAYLDLSTENAQEILETVSVRDRALRLLDHLQSKKEGIEVQNAIREKMEQRLSKVQKENLLREQMRAIREELGETRGDKSEEDYRKKIEGADLSPEAKKIALDEWKRMESIGDYTPEAAVIRNYLDLLCAMPWNKASSTEIDMKKAKEILDKDHYGLEKIKKRILQHLAVMKLKGESRGGSILLFVGPPGVGKTSLGQSIARALGRKFIRTSLGGVRDDAEIRGHRRTYVGAMPGRIIQSIKRAEENNPVMMLDEVDKLAASFQGDPMAALLEVLDPEQNSSFLDHYLDVPFDLSNVFFIGTANSIESLRGPLLDRMEIIELSGYTSAEKLHIARQHLMPKLLISHGIPTEKFEITDAAILKIITNHTREAGVRDLQRKISELMRANAMDLIEAPGEKLQIDAEKIDKILGPERFVQELAEKRAAPGVVTGLAWTPMGGEILFVESALMAGNGKLTITGQLGDVMKESAQIALSLVRSRISLISKDFKFEEFDLHIHVPAGSVPKDGPSAGISLFTSIASLFTNRSVDPKLAMTGEITLRGSVLPVGGIKEKVLAAHRAGIETILLPKRNEKDLADVPEDVRAQLKIAFAENADDVLVMALGILPEIQKPA